MPCERCSSKNVDCVYPSAASPAQALDSPSSAISDYASTPGASESVPSSILESTAFPRQMGQSLPYVDTNSYPEQQTTNLAESWSYNSYPELSSQATGFISGSLPVYTQALSPHDPGIQPVAQSPFEGSYSGTETSFDIPYGSPFPRDRHASLDQLSRRPRLVPSSRSKTAILDSDSPQSQLTFASHREAAYSQVNLRGSFHRSFTPATSYLSRRRRFNFPLSGDVLPTFQHDSYTSFDMLSKQTYSMIYRSFTTVCTGLTAYQPPYGSSCFPSRRTLNALVKLYLDRFHPVMPILHHPTLDLNGCHWLLSLAVVTIGSHMSDFEQSEEFALCFDEFLRRAISALVRRLPSMCHIDARQY